MEDILSAGQDRAFRLFSVIQDQQSRELSQRHVSKRAKKLRVKEEEIKLKPVICFDFAEIRERDWCNVVTCHMDTSRAYHILTPSTSERTPIKACTISACGNFAFLGTEGGWIERFNLQSGQSRGSYGDMSESRNYAHDGEVDGVACDATNSLMISAGYHGDKKVWDFKGRHLKSRWDVGSSVVKIGYHRANGNKVRKFEGHTDRVTDMCFSEDGKWLLSSSMDGTLRVWDVILARQIDAIHVDVSITALSLSPNMDVLATSHVEQNGVYLWVNQAMFSGSSNVDSYASGKNVVSVKLPAVSSNGDADNDSDNTTGNQSQNKDTVGAPLQDYEIPDLVTLSLLPKSQWQSLINLDIIKMRNKPIEPPKKPEKAPFFLPTVPTLSGDIVFKPSDSTLEEKKENREALGNHTRDHNLPASKFLQLLQTSADTKSFALFTKYIKDLSPSALDMELRMLQIVDDEDEQEPEKRPEMHFIEIHGETVRCHSQLQDKAKELLEVHSPTWQRIDKMFQSTRCMVSFFSNAQF
ncbi:hypothetical protein MKW98_007090 [Papaver atlanticum]|uniref:WDR36/Utp21 C-terminal domain-containing protein n=1 Tax=Papaver atlanticum TaxID=357466 RepID=A0AAD4SV66_9MAGN|nr:hypothetical protein MKW98_007090 [Papaver atlanticum]